MKMINTVQDWYTMAFQEDMRGSLGKVLSEDCTLTDHFNNKCCKGVDQVTKAMAMFQDGYAGCTSCDLDCDVDLQENKVYAWWLCVPKNLDTQLAMEDNYAQVKNVFTISEDGKIKNIDMFVVTDS